MKRLILGTRFTVLFWVLRATALGVAIWMLMDPTRVLVEVSTTRKSIAFLMDVSGSMLTVDPEGTADDLRRAISQGPNEKFSATRVVDEAHAAAGIAEKHLQEASHAIVQHQRESLVVETTAAANEAIRSVLTHVKQLSEELKTAGSEKDRCLREKVIARKLVKELEGSEFIAFSELCEA